MDIACALQENKASFLKRPVVSPCLLVILITNMSDSTTSKTGDGMRITITLALAATLGSLVFTGTTAAQRELQPGEPFIKMTWDETPWNAIIYLNTLPSVKKVYEQNLEVDFIGCKSIAEIIERSHLAKKGMKPEVFKKIDKPVFTEGLYLRASPFVVDGIECELRISFKSNTGLILKDKKRCLISDDARAYSPYILHSVDLSVTTKEGEKKLGEDVRSFFKKFIEPYAMPNSGSAAKVKPGAFDNFQEILNFRLEYPYTQYMSSHEIDRIERECKLKGQRATSVEATLRWETNKNGFRIGSFQQHWSRRGSDFETQLLWNSYYEFTKK